MAASSAPRSSSDPASSGHVYAVVMAGGSGTRFWPASRETRPKQFLPLAGGTEPLLAATVRRLAPLVPPEHVYIATGARLKAGTHEILPQVPAANVLAEPVPRNTAPCIGWASSILARLDPEARVIVLPSDHHIENEEAFRSVLQAALDAAEAGNLVTVGIVPTRAETGYGYIELGDALASGGARRVARFVEKPDLARATSYLEGKNHLWNAGMFIFRVRDMLAAIEAHLPALAAGLVAIEQGTESTLAEVFPTLPSISIDHGVMEKAANLAVVPGDFGWNDVGSWQSAWELAPKDAHANALPAMGTALSVAVDARGNIVQCPEGKTVALLGVEGLVVVDTGDALLVMPRDRAQDVRAVVEALRAQRGPV